MTLHAAKGLEFDTVFLPGWEEGLFPHQRALDESGLAGLEEERRLAYVGITRAKKRAKISFAANRRIHNLWQNALPSRFIDELPEANVEVEQQGDTYSYGPSRFDEGGFAGSDYDSPGWRRARANAGSTSAPPRRAPMIDAQATLIATSAPDAEGFARGERVFHQKFGYGRIESIEGTKLTVAFEKAGTKKVISSFVERT